MLSGQAEGDRRASVAGLESCHDEDYGTLGRQVGQAAGEVTQVGTGGIEQPVAHVRPTDLVHFPSGGEAGRSAGSRCIYVPRRVDNIRLKVRLGSQDHASDPFSLDPGTSLTIPVVVGGYDGLVEGTAALTSIIEVTPRTNESVQIIRNDQIEVIEGRLRLQILNEEFTRAASGKVQFVIENTGEAEIEIVLKTEVRWANRVEEVVRERHPYETPAILRTTVASANPDYARWVAESTERQDES